MIIADENLHQQFIDRLSADGFDVFLIREQLSGISDYKVAAFAQDKQGLIITEDKDFGELVFAHNIRGISVVFLRYDKADLEQVTESFYGLSMSIPTEQTIILSQSRQAKFGSVKFEDTAYQTG